MRDLFSQVDRPVRDASIDDLRKTVAAILQDRRAALHLTSMDIAFVAVANHWLGEELIPSLSYARLTELYAMILEQDNLIAPSRDAEVPRAINQLIDQRVLIEQVGAPALYDRRYALGPIGRAIANAYDIGQTLEAGRLTALLAGLQAELEGAIEEARLASLEARTPNMNRTWAVIGGLLNDIDARRANLDYRQELLRAQIPEMMGLETWEAALARCEDVLRNSYQAAEEVKLCLLKGHQRLQKQIERLIGMTKTSDPEVMSAADDLDARLMLLAEWASSRFDAWAGFHRQAMHFLTEMVRLDPHRTLARVLNEQIRNYAKLMLEEGALPYGLPVCQAELPQRIRPVELPELGKPVAVTFEIPVEEHFDSSPADRRLAEIEEALADSLATTGEAKLHSLLDRFADLPPLELSQLAGRVIQLMLDHACAEPSDASTDLTLLSPGLRSETLRVVPLPKQAP